MTGSPTGVMQQRQLAVSVLRCSKLETRNHLFSECNFSEEIWRNLTQKLLSVQYTSKWNEVTRLINDQTRQKVHLFLLRYVFQAALSTIWCERNGRQHGEKPNAHSVLIKQIDKLVRNRISSITTIADRKYTTAMETWFSFR